MTDRKITVYVEIPASEFPHLRELSNKALAFPVAMEDHAKAVAGLMTDREISPEDFADRFGEIFQAFEGNLQIMSDVLAELAPGLRRVTVTDPEGRKEPLQ